MTESGELYEGYWSLNDSWSIYCPMEEEITFVQYMMDGWVTVAVVMAGLIGHVSVIRQIWSRKSSRTMFLTLAALDCCMLWTALFYYALLTIEHYIYGYNSTLITYLNQYLRGVIGFSMTSTAWIQVLVLRTQYIVIVTPLGHRSFTSMAHQSRVCTAVVIMAALYACPVYLETYVEKCVRYGDAVTGYRTVLTSLGDNYYFYAVYHVIMQCLFVTTGPFIVGDPLILGFGVGIINALRQRNVINKRRSTRMTSLVIRKNTAAMRRDYVCFVFRIICATSLMMSFFEHVFETHQVSIVAFITLINMIRNRILNILVRILQKVTKRVLIIAFKFLLSRVLIMGLSLTDVVIWGHNVEYNWYFTLAHVGNLMVMMNSATNCFFHGKTSSSTDNSGYKQTQMHCSDPTRMVTSRDTPMINRGPNQSGSGYDDTIQSAGTIDRAGYIQTHIFMSHGNARTRANSFDSDIIETNV